MGLGVVERMKSSDLLDSECMLMGVTVQYSLIFTFECFIDHTTANLDKN